MARVELLTVGEAFEDLVFVGMPRLPRPGEELRVGAFGRLPGGGAIRTAIAARRLGLVTSVVSAVGGDGAARLARERVGLVNLLRPGEAQAVSVALSTPANRSFVTFDGVNRRLEARLFAVRSRFAARHVHFAFHPSDCGRWARLLRALRRAGISTSWDFGWHERLPLDPAFPALVASLDLLFLNEDEARLYSGRRRLDSAIGFWRLGARETVVKLGRLGAVLVSPAARLEAPARRVKVVDTTGAGDAFNGGFLFGRLRGRGPLDCLRLGNFVAGRAIGSAGGLDALPHERDLR